jgi:hypothetical protein
MNWSCRALGGHGHGDADAGKDMSWNRGGNRCPRAEAEEASEAESETLRVSCVSVYMVGGCLTLTVGSDAHPVLAGSV